LKPVWLPVRAELGDKEKIGGRWCGTTRLTSGGVPGGSAGHPILEYIMPQTGKNDKCLCDKRVANFPKVGNLHQENLTSFAKLYKEKKS